MERIEFFYVSFLPPQSYIIKCVCYIVNSKLPYLTKTLNILYLLQRSFGFFCVCVSKQIIGSHHEKYFDYFPDAYEEHLFTKTTSRQVYSDRLLMHSAPASLPKFFSTPKLDHSSLRER